MDQALDIIVGNAYNGYTMFGMGGSPMAVLNIRNLPDEVRDRLRIRAARANRSMEAEARAIIATSCEAPATVDGASLQAWVSELYCGRTPTGVVDDLIAERRRDAETE